jgi:hypothetical protein
VTETETFSWFLPRFPTTTPTTMMMMMMMITASAMIAPRNLGLSLRLNRGGRGP